MLDDLLNQQQNFGSRIKSRFLWRKLQTFSVGIHQRTGVRIYYLPNAPEFYQSHRVTSQWIMAELEKVQNEIWVSSHSIFENSFSLRDLLLFAHSDQIVGFASSETPEIDRGHNVHYYSDIMIAKPFHYKGLGALAVLVMGLMQAQNINFRSIYTVAMSGNITFFNLLDRCLYFERMESSNGYVSGLIENDHHKMLLNFVKEKFPQSDFFANGKVNKAWKKQNEIISDGVAWPIEKAKRLSLPENISYNSGEVALKFYKSFSKDSHYLKLYLKKLGFYFD